MRFRNCTFHFKPQYDSKSNTYPHFTLPPSLPLSLPLFLPHFTAKSESPLDNDSVLLAGGYQCVAMSHLTLHRHPHILKANATMARQQLETNTLYINKIYKVFLINFEILGGSLIKLNAVIQNYLKILKVAEYNL